MPTIVEIAWLAGLLEGEGCFLLKRGKSPQLTLKMTDLDTIEKAKTIFRHDGKISIQQSDNENHKTSYYIQLCSDHAASWMMTIYPFMSMRRKIKLREIILVWQQTIMQQKSSDKAKNFIKKMQFELGLSEERIREIIAENEKC